MTHDYTTEELAAITYYPFDPPEGYIFDHEQLSHWVHDVLMVSRESGRSSADRRGEDRLVRNSRFVALATSALITTVTLEQQIAERVGDDAAASLAAQNGSRVVEFVDGLVASPPLVVLIPIPPFPVYVFPLPPVPEPEPPDWEVGEELTGVDLIALAVRFNAGAETVSSGALQKEFLTAAERLIDIGHSRLALARK